MKENYKALVNQLSLKNYMSELDENDLKKLKSVMLNATVEISKICKKNNINVFLVGGSALGAVRHHGFIPWDDDLDISMTRSDFEKFKLIFENELGDKYILTAPNYSKNPLTRFPKILIKNTKMETIDLIGDDRAMVFIDIFILENMPKNSFIRKIRGTLVSIVMGISSYVYTYKHQNELYNKFMTKNKKIKKIFKKRIFVGRIFSIIKLKHWFDWVDKLCQYKKNTGIVGIPSGRKHYFGEIFSKDVFFPLVETDFEGFKLSIPNNYDLYLRNLYGDYMQIPPIDKREKHYICSIKFDL